jgi:hypothetical protein
LILDSHGSYVTIKFLDYYHLHNILVTVYTPHFTYQLQSLDVLLFDLLAICYSQELNQFQMDCEGFCHISKQDFFRLFWKAYEKTFILSNIQNGWGKTGIHLFVPEMVLIEQSLYYHRRHKYGEIYCIELCVESVCVKNVGEVLL